MKVLVAEDDAVTRRLIESVLVRWGYEVTTVADGTQAWEALSGTSPPAMAILDWIMPGLDGPELCRRVRDDPGLSSTYVILLTAKETGEDVVEGLEAGADDYVSKPFQHEVLRARCSVGSRVVALQNERVRRETARYIEQLEQTVTSLQQSRARIVHVQEHARRTIAEELHGSVQTRPLVLSMRIQDLGDEHARGSESLKAELAEVVSELDDVRDGQVRAISHKLHPSIVRMGLVPALHSLSDRYDSRFAVGLNVSSEVAAWERGGQSSIPLDVRLAMYRVAEEVLANVLKHAEAERCRLEVDIDVERGDLRMVVEDDGQGFDATDAHRGLGTATMEDYVGALGGTLRVDSAPTRGTRITATAPVSNDDDLRTENESAATDVPAIGVRRDGVA